MSVDYTPLTQREWRKVAGRMAEEADQLRAERDVLKKHHDLWKLAAIQNARRADLMGEAAEAALAERDKYKLLAEMNGNLAQGHCRNLHAALAALTALDNVFDFATPIDADTPGWPVTVTAFSEACKLAGAVLSQHDEEAR